MKLAGRVAAAIEIFQILSKKHEPLKFAMKEWGRNNRFAGSADRYYIGALVSQAFRDFGEASFLMGNDEARAIIFYVLIKTLGLSVDEIEALSMTKFAFTALSENEGKRLKLIESKKNVKISDLAIKNFTPFARNLLKNNYADSYEKLSQVMSTMSPLDLRLVGIDKHDKDFLSIFKEYEVDSNLTDKNSFRIRTVKFGQKPFKIDLLPLYQSGKIEVQDFGSQLCARSVPASCKTILDFCAGSGGKSLAMAANLVKENVQITAFDKDPHRLKNFFPRLLRSSLTNINILSPAQKQFPKGKFDCVVLDVPCSGSGVWRRNPQEKWKFSKEKLYQLLPQQEEILSDATKFISNHGYILYITCSLFDLENDQQIMKFLEKKPNMKIIDIMKIWQENNDLQLQQENFKPRQKQFGIQLCPLTTNSDGFYISLLKMEE